MNGTITAIPLGDLALAFIPLAVLLVVMLRWSLDAVGGLYAVGRMLLQLILIGYALTWLFSADNPLIMIGVLTVMLAAASWIALRPLGQRDPATLGRVFAALASSGGLTLALIVTLVLRSSPWFEPRLLIPLGGMIFASSMNAVSIAAERYANEAARDTAPRAARQQALQAALIPLLNSLLAVGLVSLPGMMTGQILAGVDPLLAVRYQIMVMCMLTGGAGCAAAAYLWLTARAAPAPPAGP